MYQETEWSERGNAREGLEDSRRNRESLETAIAKYQQSFFSFLFDVVCSWKTLVVRSLWLSWMWE